MTINSQQKFGIKTTRKEPNMTQVTLEHREPISFGPMSIQFTKFDTDDKQFENEANELRQKWHREYHENLQKFLKEIETETQQMDQIQAELDTLRWYSSQPQRFSKEYQAKHEKLQQAYQEHDERYCESLRKLTPEETEHPIGTVIYQNYQTLLKERGYVLVNKTTSDAHTTTEIWNKE